MNIASMDYIINTISRTNVLPIITKCNTACSFCSHKQNMPEVEAFALPELSIDDLKELSVYLSPSKKIIIGESATRIVEGEPLLHDKFIEILGMLRKKFRKTIIQITTNGILLSHILVDKMVAIGNIELNISVNCVNPEKRNKILGKNANIDIKQKLELISGRIPFSGSSVYVPKTMNNEDLEELVSLLENCNASMVRLFVPGYTGKFSEGMNLYEIYSLLSESASKLGIKYDIPVIVEPSLISSLECRLEGIIKNSPSQKAGLKTGDIIYTVDGIAFQSRVDTFDQVYRRKDPELGIIRDNGNLRVKLLKHRNESPGFVVLYDIRTEEADKIIAAVKAHKATSVLLITSELALPIISSLFKTVNIDFNLKIIAAQNSYFGGTIKCAGLLTAQDIISAVENYLDKNVKPELVMLPPIMFDYKGKDLLGNTISEIAEKIEITTCIPE